MFKYLQIIFLLSFFYSSGQVNLITNPGFESNNGCATGGGQWQFCNNWDNVNLNPGAGPWGTPDYFHTCGTGNTAPPATFSGTCATQSGNAMMALVMYNVPFPQYREYLATQLSCPMQPGTTYTLSFWLSNGTGIKSPYTIKNIGAHFSAGPLTQTGWNLINVIPQCEITTNVVSTNWTQYVFTINPTAVWNYITIGCFRPDANNNPTLSFPNPGGNASVYANYFIDNINLMAPAGNSVFTITPTVAQSQSCGGTSSATITASNPTLNLTYTWTPGNFSTASAAGLTAGVYTVVAGNNNGCSTTTASTQFTIAPSSGLTVNLNSPTACKNTSAQLSAFVSGGTPAYSYTWMPGNLNTPVINVSQAATTIYTLFVKDNGACASTVTATLTVDPVVSNFNFNQNNCSGSFTLNNISTGASTFNWNFGDNNTSTAALPQHNYSSPGTYTISLISSSANGCKDTIKKAVTIGSIVNSNFAAQLNLCDTTVLLTNNSIGGVSYLWRFGDGATSTLQNPVSHTYSLSGNYNIWLIVSNGTGCKDSTLKTVSIIKNSHADFNLISDGCLKQISVVNTSSNNITNSWQFGDGGTSGLSNPNPYTYLNTGTYSITLIINAGSTCSATITKSLQIDNGPIPQFNYILSPCDAKVSFSNTSINGQGAYWSFGDNSSTFEDNPVHYYPAQGIYTVYLTSSPNTACLKTTSLVISVKFNSVVADFDFINPALTYNANFINLSKNANSYFWDFYDTNSSTEFEPKHTYEQMGSYTVCLAATNFEGCSDTVCKKISIDADWTFYVPNTFTPNDDNTNDIFYAYATNITDFNISVFDRWGENLFNSNEMAKGWNGTYRNKEVQCDVYVWKAEFLDLKSKKHSFTGHIQVLR